MRIRSAILSFTALSALSAVTALPAAAAAPEPLTLKPAAVADVGLPYTFTVTLLSGGSDGLESPKFLTN